MATLYMILGILTFTITFYFIITEKYPKSLVTIIGASFMIIINILDEETALETIGYNLEVLILLMGMMMIVEIMSETGIFQWIAIKLAQVSKGDPIKILIFLSLVTAFFSALLDNVTTILLIVPITIFLAKKLHLDPKPFILVQIFMSNIGGTATMIGDPPNLIIASLSDKNFNDFIINLAPIILINIFVLLFSVSFFLRKKLIVSRELRASIMELDTSRIITDKKLLLKSVTIFILVILGFLTNSFSQIGLAIIAILGSTILVLISKKKPEEVFSKIEWDTLFFFGALFVLVQGLEELGIIEYIGSYVVAFTKGDLKLTSSLLIIISGLLSPIVGSVPLSLSFGKLVSSIIPNYTGNTESLWWALSLGCCLGGNMTIVGAAANMVGTSVSKKVGIEITFKEFFKWGLFIVLQSIILSLIYIYLRY
ncbi:ArsB/NhaD family transporter [Fusobacterium sp. IOR10]|uniref:ArsB/NhaD family transporter n=1 Tax=Fusobacterium sp. IOR10 TaxID=2665157 RepID=UPI0013D08B3C|nr:ArsB/NhaD family transporter [Fusobacterium sp. IOR10]